MSRTTRLIAICDDCLKGKCQLCDDGYGLEHSEHDYCAQVEGSIDIGTNLQDSGLIVDESEEVSFNILDSHHEWTSHDSGSTMVECWLCHQQSQGMPLVVVRDQS